MTKSGSRRLVAVVLSCALGVLLACGRSSDESLDQAAVQEVPQRVVAIAPSVAEMLFELGLGDRVVGVGDYVRWPLETAGLPKLGGLFDSRLEVITALEPDLAVLLDSEERLRSQLEKMGIEVLTVRGDTLEDVVEMAVMIAERFEVEKELARFLEQWDRSLTSRRTTDGPRVLLSVTREPGRLADVLVAGKDTFLHQLLERLGAINVMADTNQSYPQVGLEEIVIRQPEVVIELQPNPGDYLGLPEDWRRIGGDLGVGEICVWVVAGDHVLIPGPRIPRLYGELEDALLGCAARSE